MKIEKNINVKFLNIEDKEVNIKLPQGYDILRNHILEPKYNLGIEVSKENPFNAEMFGELLYTVTETEIENFTIEEPTNLFYLNVYFRIAKEWDLSLPEEELVITTEKLKEMIVKLLEIENDNLNLQNIYDAINSIIEKEKREGEQKKRFRIKTNKKPEEIPDDSVAKGGRLMFDIKEMQEEHRKMQEERKRRRKF